MWRLHKNLFVKEHFLRKTREELKEARVLTNRQKQLHASTQNSTTLTWNWLIS